jgi:hypothetical protein
VILKTIYSRGLSEPKLTKYLDISEEERRRERAITNTATTYSLDEVCSFESTKMANNDAITIIINIRKMLFP